MPNLEPRAKTSILKRLTSLENLSRFMSRVSNLTFTRQLTIFLSSSLQIYLKTKLLSRSKSMQMMI